jgi:serine protease Do
MTRHTGPLLALTAVAAFLVGLVASGSRTTGAGDPLLARPPASSTTAATVIAPPPAAPAPPIAVGVDFAAVAARINAAVVNVDAATRGDDRGRVAPRWRRDFGDDPSAPREGSGSGFIIDPAGYILTNHHVVQDADRVTVTLADGRVFRAIVIGIDPAIDVALLQISARDALPVAPLGDSETLRVGEWVCAIGNPLGYVHSVTVGVVSFVGRKLFDPSLDAFIQTDAAISLGNSGGPLINANGRVVGMTTAISAQASNIGFAIPISQVIGVLPQLRETGRVARGYIGVGLTSVTPALHRALRLGPSHGALIQDVTAGTPAERSGLRAYDVITSADAVQIGSDDDLIRYISARPPGSIATLGIWRDGQTQTISVKLTERPVAETARARPASTSVRNAVGREQGPLGFTVRAIDDATLARQRLPETMQGVIVVDVDPAGPARLARIRAGLVVLEVNRRRILTVADFQAATAALAPGDVAAVLVYDHVSDQRVITAVVPDLAP